MERGGGIQAGRICVPAVHLGVMPGGLLLVGLRLRAKFGAIIAIPPV